MTGRDIQRMLRDEALTQKWLMNQLEKREDMRVEYTRLSHILNDNVKSANCQHIIDTSAEIITEYGQRWSIA